MTKKKIERGRDILMKYKMQPTCEYVKDFKCPHCGHAYNDISCAKLHGWCETSNGLQMIYSCPRCATLYRFHGSTIGR